jgi:peptidoglycan/LPS O-acetylase OafA/YrhL
MQVAPQPHPSHLGPRLLRWTPRVLSLLFIAFVALFALDVFGAGYNFWQTIVALFMHLLPNLALLAVVILAWRWPWVGAIGFLGFAAWYLVTFGITNGWSFDWSVYVLLAGLPALIGVLYLADWFVRRRTAA